MLEGLDKVDWSGMDADIVPQVLHSYVEGRKVDYHTIKTYENIFFLNSSGEPIVYEQEFYEFFPDRKVIAKLIPFLIEIIRLPRINIDHKINILWDLDFIASLVDYAKDVSLPEHHKYASELREMVWKGHDIYFKSLTSQNDDEKISVITLLSRYREYADIVLLQLLQRLQVETDKWRVKIMELISEHFLRTNEAKESTRQIIQDQLMSFLGKDQQDAIRITSFRTLIDMLGSETPATVIDVMLEYYMQPIEESLKLSLRPVRPGRVLMTLGTQKGVKAAIKIMERSSNIDAKFNAVYAALLLTFDPSFAPNDFHMHYPSAGETSPYYTLVTPSLFYSVNVDVQNLTAVQKQVLKVLVEQDWVWEYGTNFEERFGLPDERATMQKLI